MTATAPASPAQAPASAVASSAFERLSALLIEGYQIDPTKLTPEAPLEGLGIDSLGVAELLFDIDDEFGISVPPEASSLQTLGEVAGLIDALVAAKADGGARSGAAGAVAVAVAMVNAEAERTTTGGAPRTDTDTPSVDTAGARGAAPTSP